ncbi:MAG: SEC-C domain-containing protein [Planctomycetes bacterium]|nr:SEC-C domain-containing protein [Planctomycetota bacterium]
MSTFAAPAASSEARPAVSVERDVTASSPVPRPTSPGEAVRPVAPIRHTQHAPRPNALCPCGSGKKVKRCCGEAAFPSPSKGEGAGGEGAPCLPESSKLDAPFSGSAARSTLHAPRSTTVPCPPVGAAAAVPIQNRQSKMPSPSLSLPAIPPSRPGSASPASAPARPSRAKNAAPASPASPPGSTPNSQPPSSASAPISPLPRRERGQGVRVPGACPRPAASLPAGEKPPLAHPARLRRWRARPAASSAKPRPAPPKSPPSPRPPSAPPPFALRSTLNTPRPFQSSIVKRQSKMPSPRPPSAQPPPFQSKVQNRQSKMKASPPTPVGSPPSNSPKSSACPKPASTG